MALVPVGSFASSAQAISNAIPNPLDLDKSLIDALPYIDKEYEQPGVRDSALALIEEECRRYRPTKNYLEHLPLDTASFETEIMRAEFERLAARQPMEMLSMKRYELPGPAPGQKNDISAWNESVENSFAQLEHMATRIENLELLEKYGANSWKTHNELLSKMVDNAQKQLSGLRKEIQETNWQRKSDQLSVITKLESGNQEWNHLVQKNFDIEAACLRLEAEIDILKSEQVRIQLSKPLDRKRKVLESSKDLLQASGNTEQDPENGSDAAPVGRQVNGNEGSDEENLPPPEKSTRLENDEKS